MKTSEKTDAVLPAMYAAMYEMPAVAKSQRVTGGGNYQYSDYNDYIDAVYEPLKNNGLFMSFTCCGEPQYERGESSGAKLGCYACHVCVTCRVTHAASGQWCEVEGWGDGYDTQDKAIGKATTYAKKYALGLLFGLPCKDDTDHRSSPSPAAKEKELTEGQIEKWSAKFEKSKTPDALNATFADWLKTTPQGDVKAIVWGKAKQKAAELGLEFDSAKKEFYKGA